MIKRFLFGIHRNQILLCITLLVVGCVEMRDVTYKVAGSNTAELKKVLEHYKDDSLRLAAAEFLIDNMTLHVSFPEDTYRRYCSSMDSLFRLKLPQESMMAHAQKIYRRYASEMHLQYDAEHISFDYLIDNIDRAFELWENSDFLTHLDFDAFCEYVLPYKCVEGQTFDDWRDAAVLADLKEFEYIGNIDIYRHSAWKAYWAVHDWVVANSDLKKYPHPDLPPTLHPHALLNAQYTDCYEKAYLELMYCRANGIPAAVDFIPNWADRPGRHAWVNIHMTTRHNEPFEALDPNTAYPGYFRKSDFKLAKVFRQTYAPDERLLKARIDGVALPSSLSSVFIKDVTAEYARTTELTMRVKSRQKYLYLSVFDDEQWVPVDIARNRFGRVAFRDVGVGVTYCVTSFESGRTIQVSVPFHVSADGAVHRYEADGCVQDVTMSRKYPAQYNIYRVRELLQGGFFEAGDCRDFKDSEIVGECAGKSLFSGEIRSDYASGYRFLRLWVKDGQKADFAEILFYSEDGVLLRPSVYGCHIGDDGTVLEQEDLKNVCDGDALTNFTVENAEEKRWVGFDFGQPVSLSRIVYLRRGDGNDIVPGHTYELFYNDGRDWYLHDRVVADGPSVTFCDVPQGLLLQVRDVFGGSQNRIFVYQDGKPEWR